MWADVDWCRGTATSVKGIPSREMMKPEVVIEKLADSDMYEWPDQ